MTARPYICRVHEVPAEAVDYRRSVERRLGDGVTENVVPVAYHLSGKPSPIDAVLVIPAGTKTDGATGTRWMPAGLREKLGPGSRVHDALLGCADPGYPDALGAPVMFPPSAHVYGYEAWTVDPDCPQWLAYLASVAVRVNGVLHLNRRLRRASAAVRPKAPN